MKGQEYITTEAYDFRGLAWLPTWILHVWTVNSKYLKNYPFKINTIRLRKVDYSEKYHEIIIEDFLNSKPSDAATLNFSSKLKLYCHDILDKIAHRGSINLYSK